METPAALAEERLEALAERVEGHFYLEKWN